MIIGLVIVMIALQIGTLAMLKARIASNGSVADESGNISIVLHDQKSNEKAQVHFHGRSLPDEHVHSGIRYRKTGMRDVNGMHIYRGAA